jgi:thiol-disulfide isomerase/thioredoxin
LFCLLRGKGAFGYKKSFRPKLRRLEWSGHLNWRKAPIFLRRLVTELGHGAKKQIGGSMKSLLLTAFFVFSSFQAQAGGVKPYSAAELNRAQQAGETVVLDFHAPWCPVCRKQEKVLKPLANESEFARVTVLSADFDSEKELRKEYGVQMQGTLIVFRGSKEIARQTGVTGADQIKMLVRKGIE